jgi:5-methylcytosine-specific restriction endonuclease McrA
MWDQVAAFAVAARLAAAGELIAACDRFATIAETDARDWFARHGKMSCYTRRSPEAIARLRMARKVERSRTPMSLRRRVYSRDHYVCRYCGLPTIDGEVTKALAVLLGPSVVSWGGTDATRHGTALAAWTQYDHVVPMNFGGADDEVNIVTSCGGCNYGKDAYTLEELGLDDPRDRPPANLAWDGLTSLIPALRAQCRALTR